MVARRHKRPTAVGEGPYSFVPTFQGRSWRHLRTHEGLIHQRESMTPGRFNGKAIRTLRCAAGARTGWSAANRPGNDAEDYHNCFCSAGIKQFYLMGQKLTDTALFDTVQHECRREGLKPPSLNT